MFTTEGTEDTEVKPESVNKRGYTAFIYGLMYYPHTPSCSS